MRKFPAQYHLQENDVLYFSHIPKTAGMTFRTIVEDHFHSEEICPATLNAQLAKLPKEEVSKYRLFRGHLGFINLPELVPGKQIVNVTVLREPVARVISHYEYIRRMPGDPHYPAVKDMTLEEFAQKLTAGKVGKNIQTYHVAKTLRFDLDGLTPAEILEIAKESLDQFAFVGLVERFQDSLFLLSYIFGWKPILNSRKENAAKKKKSEDELPAHTLEVIQENTQLDHELYQYAREIFESRYDSMIQNLSQTYGHQPGLDPSEDLDERICWLEQHYQQRYADLHRPAPKTLLYDFREALRGSGWQRRECPAEQPAYRWIGPGTIATLDLPIATDIQTDLSAEFRVICAELMPPDILQSLKLSVNGKPVPLDLLHSDRGTRFFQGIIPQSVFKNPVFKNSPFTEFAFQVDRVTSLNELNPLDPDTRAVGLALNYIQVFPVNVRHTQSALAPFFECESWSQTIDFLKTHAALSESIIAPLVFSIQLEQEIHDHSAFLDADNRSEWVVIHKGKTDRIGAMLFKLMSKGFSPVFANDVFVVYSTQKALPSVSYTSPHVKPLYVDYLKRQVSGVVKPLYRKYIAPKPQVKK
jgi:hypothetical protein